MLKSTTKLHNFQNEVRICCHCWFSDELEKSVPKVQQGKQLKIAVLGNTGSGKILIFETHSFRKIRAVTSIYDGRVLSDNGAYHGVK